MKENIYPIQVKEITRFNLIISIIWAIISSAFVLMLFLPAFWSIKKISGESAFASSNARLAFVAILICIFFASLIIMLIKVFWNYLFLKSIYYSFDASVFVFKGGIISRFEKILPFSKIQHVIIYETFWQRMLGLSSVSIETAREGMPSQRYYNDFSQNKVMHTGPFIQHLNRQDAIKLKDQIISLSAKSKPVAGI